MADADAPAPTRRRLMIPVLAAVLALSAGAAAAFAPPELTARVLGGGAPAAPDSAAAAAEFGQFVEMDPVVINPRGSGGRRYLMARVGVEAVDAKTLERLGVLSPVARDAILDVLGQRSVEELSDIAQRDALKEDVRQALNRMLGPDGPVTRIYFTQYVLQ